tara:strand:- start:201 stop:431 length:231 start_codon:yes stop_codon:yes gene_type:complete
MDLGGKMTKKILKIEIDIEKQYEVEFDNKDIKNLYFDNQKNAVTVHLKNGKVVRLENETYKDIWVRNYDYIGEENG